MDTDECDIISKIVEGDNEPLIGKRIITEDDNLVLVLSNLVSQYPIFKSSLLEMIYKTRDSQIKLTKNMKISSSNAISVLVATDISFAGLDLSKISIVGANLRDGCFNNCDFTDADLTDVSLENCKLSNAIFQRTLMGNVKLGIQPEIHIDSEIQCFCFPPKKLEKSFILSGSRDNLIRLWDIDTGKLVMIYEGHTGLYVFLIKGSLYQVLRILP